MQDQLCGVRCPAVSSEMQDKSETMAIMVTMATMVTMAMMVTMVMMVIMVTMAMMRDNSNDEGQ